jgi:hypothetical protein
MERADQLCIPTYGNDTPSARENRSRQGRNDTNSTEMAIQDMVPEATGIELEESQTARAQTLLKQSHNYHYRHDPAML